MTVHPQPLVCVADVGASADFYGSLLDAANDHGGDEYARIIDSDGRLLLQLHAADVAHHHGAMAVAGVPFGNGVAVWFALDGFDAAVARARELGAPVVHDVHVNPNARQREFWLRDPDGYLVVLAEA